MSDIALNTSGDIRLAGDDLDFTTGQETIADFVGVRLKTFLGEWFLDQSLGVPYFEEIFKKNFNARVVDAVFKNEILDSPGIIELKEFELDLDEATRQLTLTFAARSEEGDINFSEIIP